jgi:spore coat polysaccharide biosynthesis predicted glycosyltransferase SpsG
MTREHVGYASKIKDILTKVSIPDSHDFSKVEHRISVDTSADYQFMSECYHRWYESNPMSSIVDLKWVQKELLENSAFRSINSHVQQKKPKQNYHNINLLCHYGQEIGLGHLRRCARIALDLTERHSMGVQLHVIGLKADFTWLPSQVIFYNEFEKAQSFLYKSKSEMVLLDFNPNWIEIKKIEEFNTQAKALGKKIIALDQCHELFASVDHVFIPSFNFPKKQIKTTYGWDHYLINKSSLPKKNNQVLVLTGGADTLQYGEFLPQVLEESIPKEFDIIWIQGPFASQPKLPSNIDRWKILFNPQDLDNYISESDWVISVYGLSFFEALIQKNKCLLLPSETICPHNELKALDQEKCCFILKNESMSLQIQNIFIDQTRQKAIKHKLSKIREMVNGFDLLATSIRQLLIDK